MSVACCLQFDQTGGDVSLHITDGESVASFEVRRPVWDWRSHCIECEVVIDGQHHRLLILPGFRLLLARPGGVAPPTWAGLLERFGHPLSEGVSHG